MLERGMNFARNNEKIDTLSRYFFRFISFMPYLFTFIGFLFTKWLTFTYSRMTQGREWEGERTKRSPSRPIINVLSYPTYPLLVAYQLVHISISAMQGNPSVRPFPGFNANMDAESLRKAMKGLGCNNSQVIAVLCARTAWQRQEIAKAFKVMYGKDLIKVNSESSFFLQNTEI